MARADRTATTKPKARHNGKEPDGRSERPNPSTALSKVMRVLESIGEPTGVSDVARATGMPVSTAHRILSELSELGWVVHSEDRQYLPGSRLLALAGTLLEKAGHVSLARPVMERLSSMVGYTIHLGLRVGDEAVYVEKVDGPRAYRMRSRVGMSVPLHSTGIGKVILANQTDDELRALIERTGLKRVTAHTITDPEQLLEHVAGVRKDGWAFDDGENEENTRCAAMAIYDVKGVAIGGISVSGLEYDFDTSTAARLVPLITEAAAEISRGFGASEDDLARFYADRRRTESGADEPALSS